jgi:hypothetical protein
MDTKFNLELSLTITPRWWRVKPVIAYGIDSELVDTVQITDISTLQFSLPLNNGSHCVWIEFKNKDYNDCILDQNLDMAIEIESVTVEGMTLDRFKWAGLFYPDYPAWLTNQSPVIKSATYLGWNGRWELPFTTPIFTWIHRLENLGWLYEP